MTWRARIRLVLGLVAVVAVVAVLTLLVNQRTRQAFSLDASVMANEYQIGSDYGGVVVDQFVNQGDVVDVGDKLFTVSSLSLQKDVAIGLDPRPTDAYTVDVQTGQVTYLAAIAGTLTQFSARQGSFVNGGDDMGVITAGGTQFVRAVFELPPKDYARVAPGGQAEVQLPNRRTVPATVTDVSVETLGGVASTTVTLDASELRSDKLTAFNQPGAPVSVTLTLTDDGVLAGPTDSMDDFLHRIGVR